MYLIVSGGAYGLEDAVQLAGPRLTLLLCLLVPLTLSLPTALMAAELTALMPVEGGFYFWVREALGPFAGFVEAYLTLLYTAVDMAIYPVLFAPTWLSVFPLGTAGADCARDRAGVALRAAQLSRRAAGRRQLDPPDGADHWPIRRAGRARASAAGSLAIRPPPIFGPRSSGSRSVVVSLSSSGTSADGRT